MLTINGISNIPFYEQIYAMNFRILPLLPPWNIRMNHIKCWASKLAQTHKQKEVINKGHEINIK